MAAAKGKRLLPTLSRQPVMPAFGLAFLVWVGLLWGCQSKAGVYLEGMLGTAAWHVTLTTSPSGVTEVEMVAGITQALRESSQRVAGWDQQSEISRFNAYQGADWLPVSPDLARLVETALRLGHESGGVYDITLRPLIALWGFGSAEAAKGKVPEATAITAALARVGYQKLQVQLDPPALRKVQPDLQVELASVADGYAVDVVANYLEGLGCQNYMVEVAGEIRTRGVSPRGDAWRVAIEKPQEDGRVAQQGIQLHDVGLATSGDYRNFFMQNGKRYSHTFDPATGYPVTHRLASVSVLAANGVLADGYATLLMAMGEEKGKAFALQHGLAAYFIWRGEVGFGTYATPEFSEYFLR